jgi:integrase
MHLEDYESEGGKRVWLSEDELESFLGEAVTGEAGTDMGAEQIIALELAGRCGLRGDELVDVTPADVVNGPAEQMVRVWEGKGDKYRETPMPETLAIRIETYAEHGDKAGGPIVDRPTRTVRRWVKKAAGALEAVTGDPGWQYLSPHDLRRSWAQALLDSGVEPGLVMEWGGWESWPTFREHYLGVYSPKRQRAEREKVEWL